MHINNINLCCYNSQINSSNKNNSYYSKTIKINNSNSHCDQLHFKGVKKGDGKTFLGMLVAIMAGFGLMAFGSDLEAPAPENNNGGNNDNKGGLLIHNDLNGADTEVIIVDSNRNPSWYTIKPGDTLTKIVVNVSGLNPDTDKGVIAELIKQVAADNRISDPDTIYAGSMIDVSAADTRNWEYAPIP